MQFDFTNIKDGILTKEEILKHLTQEQIASYYLSIKGTVFDYKNRVISPFRNEKRPSLTWTKINNKLYFKDWGSDNYEGDVFNLVMFLYNCTFSESLNIINNDLIVNKINHKKIISKEPLQIEEVSILNIKSTIVEKKAYTIKDYYYWGRFNISLKQLLKYNVFSCNKVRIWSNKKNNYFTLESSTINPIYCYEFKMYDGTYYKIYRPFSKIGKWFFNGNEEILQGYDQLPHLGDVLIISKALKDVMVYDSIGFNAIAPQSETCYIDDRIINLLKKRFKSIIIIFDNDRQGIISANKLSKKFNILNTKIDLKYGVKDVAEYIEKYGEKNTVELINKMINEIAK